MPFRLTFITAVCLVSTAIHASTQQADKEKLGRALEYFQAEKYHESMLILSHLDSLYTLNPRIRAFLGVCYYYEGMYDKAEHYLEENIPKLSSFSPQELSVYNWLCGESLFKREQWQKAIAFYERTALLSTGKEKADALYRIGICYINTANWENAMDSMEQALLYYIRYSSATDGARITQIKNMINGISNRIKR